jgi:hypothetical protein
MEDSQLGDTGGAYKHTKVSNHAIECIVAAAANVPDPNTLARFDSFCEIAAIGGDILSCVFFAYKNPERKLPSKTKTLELTQRAEQAGWKRESM